MHVSECIMYKGVRLQLFPTPLDSPSLQKTFGIAKAGRGGIVNSKCFAQAPAESGMLGTGQGHLILEIHPLKVDAFP